MVQSRERERESKQPVDLTLNKPRTINRANCITARYDAGVSNRQKEGTGAVESERYKI